jgi:hypothetical protein
MTGDKPWPQVPVGNKDHTSAAVVIIGAGISGLVSCISFLDDHGQPKVAIDCLAPRHGRRHPRVTSTHQHRSTQRGKASTTD